MAEWVYVGVGATMASSVGTVFGSTVKYVDRLGKSVDDLTISKRARWRGWRSPMKPKRPNPTCIFCAAWCADTTPMRAPLANGASSRPPAPASPRAGRPTPPPPPISGRVTYRERPRYGAVRATWLDTTGGEPAVVTAGGGDPALELPDPTRAEAAAAAGSRLRQLARQAATLELSLPGAPLLLSCAQYTRRVVSAASTVPPTPRLEPTWRRVSLETRPCLPPPPRCGTCGRSTRRFP